jgi:Bacteriocin-protection, YdeI or OmpD-Associated
MLRFQTTLQSDARRRVYLPLPAEPKVRHLAGTVNGMRYRGAVESIDGSPGLVLGPAWRRGCGLKAGDRVSVELEPEGPQRQDLAPDLAAALDASPAAAAFWDELAQFYRRAHLRWIDATKRSPALRAERIATGSPPSWRCSSAELRSGPDRARTARIDPLHLAQPASPRATANH